MTGILAAVLACGILVGGMTGAGVCFLLARRELAGHYQAGYLDGRASALEEQLAAPQWHYQAASPALRALPAPTRAVLEEAPPRSLLEAYLAAPLPGPAELEEDRAELEDQADDTEEEAAARAWLAELAEPYPGTLPGDDLPGAWFARVAADIDGWHSEAWAIAVPWPTQQEVAR